MKRFIKVSFPDSQKLNDSNRFNECYKLNLEEDDTYMVPEDLYEKIFKTDEIQKLRIGNIEFRKATYLGTEVEFPSYEIVFYYDNPRYGRENEFIKEGDYYIKKNPYEIKCHKSCFEHKECCYSLAFFNRDTEGYYELTFIGNRPLKLNKKELDDFMKVIRYGDKVLNKHDDF